MCLKRLIHKKCAGANAPSSLLLNISNSLAQAGNSSPVCHLSFYSPYWVDNRTNMDLVLQDHASAPPNPLLLGYKTPLDYSEVVSPGRFLLCAESKLFNEGMRRIKIILYSSVLLAITKVLTTLN